MALINKNHPALAGDRHKFWEDELNNSRIHLYDLNILINRLEHEDIKSYGIDTGQTNINTSQQDLPSLYDRREKLLKQILDLENKLGRSGLPEQQKVFQVVPSW
jgi:hypothetical protein